MLLSGNIADRLAALPSCLPPLVVREIGYFLRRSLSSDTFEFRRERLRRSLRFPIEWLTEPAVWDGEEACIVRQFTFEFAFLFPGGIVWYQVYDAENKVVTQSVVYQFPNSSACSTYTPGTDDDAVIIREVPRDARCRVGRVAAAADRA